MTFEHLIPKVPLTIIRLARLWECSEMKIREWISKSMLITTKINNRHVIFPEQARTFLEVYGEPPKTIHNSKGPTKWR